MKSIKPGRGASGMNFVSTIGAVIFGVLWAIRAIGMTAGAAVVKAAERVVYTEKLRLAGHAQP